MLSTLALALSIVAAAADAPAKPTLLALAKKAAADGTSAALGKGAVTDLHLADLALKVLPEVPADRTDDGLAHDFYVGMQNGALRCVVFGAHKKEPPHVKATYFRADMGGRLENVAAITGDLDEEGQPVKGSGVLSQLDPDDEDVVKRFRHERDFWLKDAYRKTAEPAKK